MQPALAMVLLLMMTGLWLLEDRLVLVWVWLLPPCLLWLLLLLLPLLLVVVTLIAMVAVLLLQSLVGRLLAKSRQGWACSATARLLSLLPLDCCLQYQPRSAECLGL